MLVFDLTEMNTNLKKYDKYVFRENLDLANELEWVIVRSLVGGGGQSSKIV